MTQRTQWIFLTGLLLLTACFGIFVLPFLLPPPFVDGISISNIAGFNNRVAFVAAALASVCMFSLCWRFRLPALSPKPDEMAPMSRVFILGWSLGVTSLIVACVAFVYASGVRYLADYGYFIEQMSKAAEYHRKLYAQIEFPYGPLLFYPPIWLRGLFAHAQRPLAAAYVFTYLLEELVGCLSLAYLLQWLPITLRLRRWFFVCALCTFLVPTLGLNVVYFRFATPPAVLLLCLRGRNLRVAAMLVPIGQVLCLAISPEMGFAFAVGVCSYALVRAMGREEGRRHMEWLSILILPVVGALLFILLVGKGYFLMVALFSGGLFNLIVEPVPYVLLFLAALLWFAPMAVSIGLRNGVTEQGALIGGLYGMGIALLPVIFGRCDACHVLLSGLPIFLVALIAVSCYSRRVQYGWIGAVALVALASLVVNLRITRFQGVLTESLLKSAPVSVRRMALHVRTPADPRIAAMMAEAHPQLVAPRFDTASLKEIVGHAGVATPFDIPPVLEQYMKTEGMYRPGFYGFMQSVLDARAEGRQIAEMDAEQWVLIPSAGVPVFFEDVRNMDALTGVNLPYVDKRESYGAGVLIADDLARNWTPVRKIDGYTLYRRN